MDLARYPHTKYCFWKRFIIPSSIEQLTLRTMSLCHHNLFNPLRHSLRYSWHATKIISTKSVHFYYLSFQYFSFTRRYGTQWAPTSSFCGGIVAFSHLEDPPGSPDDPLHPCQASPIPIQYNTVQYSTLQYNTYNTVQYTTIQYNTVQYSTIQYSAIVDDITA